MKRDEIVGQLILLSTMVYTLNVRKIIRVLEDDLDRCGLAVPIGDAQKEDLLALQQVLRLARALRPFWEAAKDIIEEAE